jgi:hypothetical protein
MLNTDLHGFVNNLKHNETCQLLLLIIFCILTYIIVSKYVTRSKSDFQNVQILVGNMNGCNGDIPKMDEAIIRNMIELPNRDPKYLTTSMVLPEIKTSEEDRKRTRMDILNMFYNTFDDDLITINAKPQGLYITP